MSSFYAITTNYCLGNSVSLCAEHSRSVRLLHPFCITHCNCYLHGFVQRGRHPKLHLTYDTFSPIYVSGDVVFPLLHECVASSHTVPSFLA
jgi:hypothetical protein